MSKEIDKRVVEMQFDNSHFEKNTRQTMSTIEKLKQSLQFRNASKGLDDINSASKKLDLTNVGKAVETVKVKFSALQVMGVTALTNITNSAVNAGKRITKALTIEPVTTGFQEYETKINAVQTIMSNVSSKGKTIEDVTNVLDELNTYADKTIYNFTEMTKNIGTFTAAGVGLEDSAKAIQGIANLAAASGSNSQQASTAMYQLSQALAAGKVSLMDWNSVVNAGMGGQKFQDALKATARDHGVAVDKIIKKNGSFRESLQEGWITAEIMNETLNKFTVDGAKKYAKSMIESKKWTQAQADALIKEATSMQDAATKVKTFTQLWDTMKESVQSGWSQTWEIVFGDFEEAKEFFSDLADTFNGVIEKINTRRNNLVQQALGNQSEAQWSKLTKKINEAGFSTEKFQNALIKTAKRHGKDVSAMIKKEGSFNKTLKNGWLTKEIVAETLDDMAKGMKKSGEETKKTEKILKEYQKVFNDVWDGEYGNGVKRINALTKAGYKYSEVQALVNKYEAGHKLTLKDLNVEKLKSAGYTEKEIQMMQSLAAEAKKTDSSLNEMIENMSRPSGRDLLIESVKNILEAISSYIKPITEAWNNIMPELESEDIYNAIAKFEELTEAMKLSETAAENFTKIFEGLFALFQLTGGLIKKSFTSTVKLITAVLGLFGTNLLEVLAKLAEKIVVFRDWMNEHTFYVNCLNKVAEVIYTIVEGVINAAKAFWALEPVQKLIEKITDGISDFFTTTKEGVKGFSLDSLLNGLKNVFNNITNWISELDQKKWFQTGVNFVDGIIDGVGSGLKDLVATMKKLGIKALETLKLEWLIHSPSKKAAELGKFLTEGLVVGIMEGIQMVLETVGILGKRILTEMQTISFSSVFVVGAVAALTYFTNKITNILDKFANPFGAFGDLMDSIGKTTEKYFKAKKWQVYSEALKGFATALLLLAGALFIISYIDTKKLLISMGVLAGLMAAMVVMTRTIKDVKPIEFAGAAVLIASIGLSLIAMAAAFKLISTINPDQVKVVLSVMTGAFIGMASLVAVYGKMIKGKAAANVKNAGKLFRSIAVSMLLMAVVFKIAGSMSYDEIESALQVVAGMGVLIAGVILVSKFAGKNGDRAGYMIGKIGLAMLAMAAAIKIMSGIDEGALTTAINAVTTISLLFMLFVELASFTGDSVDKAGKAVLSMSASMILMAFGIKLIAEIPENDILKALAVMAAIELLFLAFMAISKMNVVGHEGVGMMLLKMATSMIVMGVAIKILAGIELKDVVYGTTVIGALLILFAVIIEATYMAGQHADKAGTMIFKMSLAIGILVGVIALISILDYDAVKRGTIVVTALLGMFALITYTSKFAADSMKSLIVMTVAIGLLVGAVVALSFMNQEKVKAAGTALAAVMGMFALLLAASHLAKNAIGTMIVMTLAIGAIAFVMYKLSDLPYDGAMTAAKAISMVLIALSVAFAIVSVSMKSIAGSVIVILGALVVAIGLIAAIFWAMQELDIKPSMEAAKALSIMLMALASASLLLAALGAVSGPALAGVLTFIGVISALGGFMLAIGALMSYYPKMEEFLNKGMSVLTDIGFAVGEFFGSIIGGFSEGIASGLPGIGEKLGQFMENAKPFFDNIEGVDGNTLNGVKSLAEAIYILTKNDIITSLTGWITGGNSISDFVEQLLPLGNGMKAYGVAVNGINIEAIKASTEAAKGLAEFSKILPNYGGLAAVFAGDNTIQRFGTMLPQFGKSMKEYGASVEGLLVQPIANSVSAAKSIVEVANSIPKTGGIKSWFSGNNSMSDFGSKMAKFGGSLVSYGKSVKDLNRGDIVASKESVDVIIGIMNKIANVDTAGVQNFKDAVYSLSGVSMSTVTTAFNSCNKGLKSTGANMVYNIVKGINDSKEALKTSINKSISGIAESATSRAKTLVASGKAVVTNFNKGLKEATPNAKKKSLELVNACRDAIKTEDNFEKFKGAGSYLVTGLANGISENSYRAEAKAAAMANAAYKAAKDALKINSPSKKFYELGLGTGEGFIYAMEDSTRTVYRASGKFANEATNGFSNAISKVMDVINSDMDTSPTIRPVLDLSNVESGMGYVNGMFGGRTLAVDTSMSGSVSASMSGIQNGPGNGDIISAIQTLGKNLANIGGNTYTVNGVTYDDGSNIKSAIESIVRTARIERRV